LTKAILVVEEEFPGCQVVFIFNNATCHMKYAQDALRLFKTHFEDRGMNSKPTCMSLVVVSTPPENG